MRAAKKERKKSSITEWKVVRKETEINRKSKKESNSKVAQKTICAVLRSDRATEVLHTCSHSVAKVR